MRHVEIARVRKILAASAGVHGADLFSFERPQVGTAFVTDYRTAAALAVSAPDRRYGGADRVLGPQVRASDGVCNSGVAAVAGDARLVGPGRAGVVVAIGAKRFVMRGALRDDR